LQAKFAFFNAQPYSNVALKNLTTSYSKFILLAQLSGQLLNSLSGQKNQKQAQ
jgi:hypothetical protein